MTRDLYVVAHGEAQHHVDGLVGGWYDSELTTLGRHQAEAIARSLSLSLTDRAPVEIYASDLRRTAQTATPIGQALGAPVTHLSDLRELSYGVAGGRPNAWLEARAVLAPQDGDRLDHVEGIEGAETKRAFATRIYRAMGQILASPCPNQIIVTHGYAVTFVIAAWIRMPLESVGWVNFRSSSGGISYLREDDTRFNRTVLRLNDTTHLAPQA